MEEKEFISPIGGFLLQNLLKSGDKFQWDSSVAVVFECNHGIQVAGLCSKCGKEVGHLSQETITYGHNTISLTRKEAKRVDGEKEKALLKQRKLALVLDLDQTLIHATTENNIAEKPVESDDLFEFTLASDPLRYFVKLRPGLRQFLRNLSDYFKLHIYTMGTRLYADQIARIIDPNRTYFGDHQIIARDDFSSHSGTYKKNLQHIFPCKDHMAIIIDDREDVWTDNHGVVSQNLIPINPYYYFRPTEELNASPVAAEGQITLGQDKALSSLELILKRVHYEFYKIYDLNNNNNNNNNSDRVSKQSSADCKTILKKMRRNTLSDCKIVFSGVIPVNNTEPQKVKEWKLAESLGATCQLDITDSTTHVIAKNSGTSKVHNAAKQDGIYIVSYAWFLECAQTWTYQDVFQYPVSPHISVLKVNSIPRYQHKPTSELCLSESSSSDYDQLYSDEDDQVNVKRSKIEKQLLDTDSVAFYSTDEDDEELSVSKWAEALEEELEESLFAQTN